MGVPAHFPRSLGIERRGARLSDAANAHSTARCVPPHRPRGGDRTGRAAATSRPWPRRHARRYGPAGAVVRGCRTGVTRCDVRRAPHRAMRPVVRFVARLDASPAPIGRGGNARGDGAEPDGGPRARNTSAVSAAGSAARPGAAGVGRTARAREQGRPGRVGPALTCQRRPFALRRKRERPSAALPYQWGVTSHLPRIGVRMLPAMRTITERSLALRNSPTEQGKTARPERRSVKSGMDRPHARAVAPAAPLPLPCSDAGAVPCRRRRHSARAAPAYGRTILDHPARRSRYARAATSR